ncbi:MAG: hypothetical protein KDI62_23200 [Anaerolineae bacterium]|nr:hypothetical protein [Anaerolineae bacterium]MCB0181151.1 hypothetical protein [Anaerolineae bacterium]MCB9106193.1 hypothetical protein [Anaerolineales bacterium]
MAQPTTLIKSFPNGRQALSVRVNPETDAGLIIDALRLPKCRRLLMLSGGASNMSAEKMSRLTTLFTAIGRLIVQNGITVIDGGTESGVMKLMGEALGRAGRTKSPHIGVLPAYVTVADDGTTAEDMLEPNHSNFVLVEGDEWGSEVEQMYRLAAYFSQHAPSVALLVNGGDIALREIELNVEQNREIIVLAGSGRLADEVAQAIQNSDSPASDRVKAVVRQGRFIVVDLEEPPELLIDLLRQKLL